MDICCRQSERHPNIRPSALSKPFKNLLSQWIYCLEIFRRGPSSISPSTRDRWHLTFNLQGVRIQYSYHGLEMTYANCWNLQFLAVRMGNLQKFHEHLQEFHTQFQQDRTYILIQRLRHNVIKTGLRAISTSYSRILLKDIASKLALDAPEDVEFIVAKVQSHLPLHPPSYS